MSTLRISGLASGMDIDSMVTKLMTAERMPLDKLKQKKQVLEWQRDDYRSMNTLLLNFRTELTNMKLTTKYRSRTTTSTNEAQISATASSAASQASYSISNVKLATAATLTNGGKLSAAGKTVDLNKGLYLNQSDFENNASFDWKQGSVESQTINVTNPVQTQKLILDPSVTPDPSIQLTDIKMMNVRVNGKAIEVVDAAQVPTPGDNQVSVDSSGNLTFGAGIKIDTSSKITVDYFTNKKKEILKPTASTNDLQLSKKSIANVESLTVKVSDTQTDSYTLQPNATDTNHIDLLKPDNTAAGYIDKTTGLIHFDTAITSGQEVNITYQQNYTNFSVQTYATDGTIAVKENFGVQGNDTLSQVISKVNASNAGVSMFYDSFSDKMTLTRKVTGDFNKSGSEILTSGKFIDEVLKFGTTSGAVETGGKNATFTINGLDTERTSNNFDINGVTFTLKQEITSGQVNISVNNDSNAVYDNIKAFVDKYNELLDKIQSKVSEDHYRDYPPLTDDQKQQLSETQQEQWTTKAKSGMLRRDPILTGVLDRMRSNFYSPVNNSQVNPAYNQLADIGITTTANYLEGGKLEINEAKLKAAIQADPDSVENLFRGTGSTSSEQGVIQRLFDTVTNTMDSLKVKAGSSYSTNKQFAIGMQLDTLNSQITSFEGRMKQVEDRYYSQFTAMEQAIQKANSQSTYLTQQFSGGQ